MSDATSTQSRLHIGTKIGWGMADAGINVFVFLKSVIIFNFMNSYLGVDAGLAGLVTALVVLSDMVTDPIVGAMSDRFTSRFGRRRPFMFVGVFLMAGLTYMTFAVPAGLSGAPAAAWVAVFYALASIAFTMVAVPFGAMATEMTTDKQERVTLTGFRMIFASVGLLLSGLLFAPQVRADFAGGGWIVLSLLMILPVLIAIFATRNAPTGRHGADAQAPGLLEQYKIVANSPSFLKHMIAYGVMTLGVAIISTGIRSVTEDITASQAQSGAFDDFLSAYEPNERQLVRLGIVEPEDGFTTRAGDVIDQSVVPIAVGTADFDVSQLDLAFYAAHPYGPEQIGTLKGILNQAIASKLSMPFSFLVGLAGFFSAVFALFLLGSIISQALWVPLAARIGRDNTLLIGLIAYGIILIAYMFVLRSGNLNLIVGLPFLLGACNGCYQNLPWAILPTMIDQANQEHGKPCEGVFNGYWLTGQKMANAIGPAIFGIMLGVVGFQESTLGFQFQNAEASRAMEMLMTLVPGIFFLVAIPIFLWVPKALRH